MSKFAEFDVSPSLRAGALDVSVRLARAEDEDAIARLFLDRNGGDEAAVRDGVRADVEANGDGRLLCVAIHDGQVVGYGRARVLDYSKSGSDAPPSGWYLVGVVVAPEHRRRGVGRALTEARIELLRSRTDRVHYFASLLNRASIALHTELGFRLVQRPATVPGVPFSGGEGALFELSW